MSTKGYSRNSGIKNHSWKPQNVSHIRHTVAKFCEQPKKDNFVFVYKIDDAFCSTPLIINLIYQLSWENSNN